MNSILRLFFAVIFALLACGLRCGGSEVCCCDTIVAAEQTPEGIPAGMTMVLLGDSNTWIGGDDCSRDQGWSHRFAELARPADIRSYARSGATWSHTRRTVEAPREYSEVLADNNVVYNQIVRLEQAVADGSQPEPDLIIVMAGTNDAWFPQHRPEEFSLTAAEAAGVDAQEIAGRHPSQVLSLGEAVRYDLLRLSLRFPSARIVVLTPFESVKVSAQMLEAVSDIIEEVALKSGASLVVRMDRVGPIRSESEMTHRRFTTDGTHTSAEGAGRVAEVVAAALNDYYRRMSGRN